MDPATIGALLGGAGQFAGGIGGLFGKGGPAIMQSMAPQLPFSSQTILDLNERDFQWQKQLAQSGIQMRVSDAKAAGLHPLFALSGGQAGFSPSPIQMGGVDSGYAISGGGSDIGASLSNMGQGLGRAIAATQSKEARALDQFEIARRAQQLEHGALQNQWLQTQINKANAPAVGPPMPMPGNPALGPHEMKPNEVTTTQPSAPHIAAGPGQPSVDFHRMADGGLMPAPPKTLNIDEASSPGWLSWMFTNRILPMFDGKTGKPSDAALPPGAYRWQYTGMNWHPVYHADYINRTQGKGPLSHLPESNPYSRPGWAPSSSPYYRR